MSLWCTSNPPPPTPIRPHLPTKLTFLEKPGYAEWKFNVDIGNVGMHHLLVFMNSWPLTWTIIYSTSLRLHLANSETNSFMSRFSVISFSCARMTKFFFLECSIVRRSGVRMRFKVEKELSHAAEDTPMTSAVTYIECNMGKASLYCWMHLHASERLASVGNLLSNIAFATEISFSKLMLLSSVPASTWSGFRREGSRNDFDFGRRNDVDLISSTFLWENLVSISTIALSRMFNMALLKAWLGAIWSSECPSVDKTTLSPSSELTLRFLLGGGELVGLLPPWEKCSCQNESLLISFRVASEAVTTSAAVHTSTTWACRMALAGFSAPRTSRRNFPVLKKHCRFNWVERPNASVLMSKGAVSSSATSERSPLIVSSLVTMDFVTS